MFNRAINNIRSTEYVPYEKTVNVHEYKAPTDESIRILNEFEEKAKDNLVAKFEIKQGFLDAVVLFFNDNQFDQTFDVFYKFNLNGEECKFKTKIEFDEWMDLREEIRWTNATEVMAKLIYKKFSETIAERLVKVSLPEINKFVKFK